MIVTSLWYTMYCRCRKDLTGNVHGFNNLSAISSEKINDN